jgi:hypothetical protein
MHQGKDLTSGVLGAARRLLESSSRVEAQLARTLDKCDKINFDVCAAVSITLTKLVQDIAGAPLALADYITCPRALRCVLTVLSHILRVLKPDRLQTQDEIDAADAAARSICAAHHLPAEVGEMATILVTEIAFTFQKLDAVLQPPFVKKDRNSEILRARVAHFLRDVQADLLVVSFASIKLSVCARALAEGCFQMRRSDKQLLEKLLLQTRTKARFLASINDAHRQNILVAGRMAAPRGGHAISPRASFF